MSTFLKLFLSILLTVILALYLTVNTDGGRQLLRNLASQKLSQKSGLNVIVKSIDLKAYPTIVIELYVEKKARLTLTGSLTNTSLNMDYTLTSECVASEICTIDDAINISGHIYGPYSRMLIQGEGKALDGNITYHLIKETDRVEDLNLQMRDVNSTKLFTLMGYEELIKGKANVDVHFAFMEENNKEGSFFYEVKESNLSGVILDLNAGVKINGMQHTFYSNITSPHVNLYIFDGTYDQGKKVARSTYILDVKDLSELETLLGYRYLGPLYTTGEMIFNNHLMITGHSATYGGRLNYFFEKDGLFVDLHDVSFMKFMGLFPYPKMLNAEVNGNLYYNFLQKTLVVNTKLDNAKIAHSRLIRSLRKTSTIDLRREIFHESYLDAIYHDGILAGDLKFRNERSHLYLTSIHMNAHRNTIDAYFDVQMQSRAFSGKVYGPLDDPHINLRLQKLIKYEMSRQMDRIMGEEATRIIRQIPMEGLAEGMAAGASASFIKLFF